MTYTQAKKAGVKRYHGKPCTKCGNTERYTLGGCTKCATGTARGSYHRHRKPLDGREFVYECYSEAGELLYVGRTNNPRNRIYTHRQETPWWSEVRTVAWIQVPDLERRLIIAHRPKYNKHGSG